MRNLRSKLAAGLAMFGTAQLAGAASPESAAISANQLGLDLYRLIAKGSENVCLSPYSISSALAMTLIGADGETRAEMSRVLHFANMTDAGAEFGALQQALEKSAEATKSFAAQAKQRGGPTEPIEFTIANRLFPQQGYALRPEFVRQVQEHFHAAPELLDFKGNAAGATQQINEWVAQQTHDRIRDLIPSSLPSETRLVLANALYFKAAWLDEFAVEATTPEPFHVKGAEAIDVPTMNAVRTFGYAKRAGYTALVLPYIGGEFQLLVLLPETVGGLDELEKKLTGNELASAARLESVELDLHLPKFKFAPETMSLATPLRSLGMQNAFDDPPGSANFDRMAARAPKDYLLISEVFHKTFIAVDEKGTEAAAATAVAMMVGSALVEKPEPILVKVDRPFLYAIQHAPSGTCLFFGRVTDPR